MSRKIFLSKRNPLFQKPSLARLLWLLLCLGVGVTLVQADGPNQIGLVVSYGNEVATYCVEFNEEQITGYDVLRQAGLDLSEDASGGIGVAICRIGEQGCTYPADDCFCQCQGGPCIFWSYWNLVGNAWEFSGLGATNNQISHGQVQGWAWGEGSPGGAGAKPPVYTFDEICIAAPTPTATATPTHTATTIPTTTPTSTNTPLPTETATPLPTPIIHHFTTNKTAINRGESAILTWDLSDAKAAYLVYDNQEQAVIAPGDIVVSPGKNTVYTLIARNNGGENRVQITITVNNVVSTPTLSPLPTNPPLAVSTSPLPAPPTNTPIPEPIITFTATTLNVSPGNCTIIQWSTQQVETLFLDGTPVALQGEQNLCPAQTQLVQLLAQYPGGEKINQLTIVVEPLPPTDTPTLVPVPTDTPMREVQAPATLPTATPATLVVIPTITPLPQPNSQVGAVENPNDGVISGQLAGATLMGAGLVMVVIGLFVVVPMILITVGGIFWWLTRKNRRHNRF